MIVTVFARVIPPRQPDGWASTGFDVPRFILANESSDKIPGNPNGFTTCEQAGTIACDLVLFGRDPGTIANITIIGDGEAFQRYYRVNTGGRLSSVPSTDLDENGIPTALYAFPGWARPVQ